MSRSAQYRIRARPLSRATHRKRTTVITGPSPPSEAPQWPSLLHHLRGLGKGQRICISNQLPGDGKAHVEEGLGTDAPLTVLVVEG
ncbi:hypothetical protein Cadr_000016337 [Camelus dromedarius]|uniref:Uncharacterized protein n=1 Tax=Camelus dromedarius TaxID=9838 RepID=A0A5N4EAC9_CAMDR|nr:hypothetical protein Cadr_000016337 [Camelus dromedarius]